MRWLFLALFVMCLVGLTFLVPLIRNYGTAKSVWNGRDAETYQDPGATENPEATEDATRTDGTTRNKADAGRDWGTAKAEGPRKHRLLARETAWEPGNNAGAWKNVEGTTADRIMGLLKPIYPFTSLLTPDMIISENHETYGRVLPRRYSSRYVPRIRGAHDAAKTKAGSQIGVDGISKELSYLKSPLSHLMSSV